jgi:Subtilase family
MTWYFEPPRGEHDHEDEDAPGPTDLPAALLQRHGARVLIPTDAAAVSGLPAPRSTVYVASTLLIAGHLLDDADVARAIHDALRPAGLRLEVPDRLPDLPAYLPRRAVLVPLPPGEGGPATVVVDAWTALQTLRAAAVAHTHEHLDEQAAGGIWLEHLLFGSAIAGAPASHGGGVSGSPASHGGGVTGPGATDSYLVGGWDARMPVMLPVAAPPRRPAGACGPRFGRRPVVAVLDSGGAAHPWLDVRADPAAPGGCTTVPDGFVAVDQGLQDVIFNTGILAGYPPGRLIRYPYDAPVAGEPLVGEVNQAFGHGCFIAGIVRQVVPDAQVLAIRIMSSDDCVREADLIYALGLMAIRVTNALNGDMTQMIDVISLSLGYFSESPADQAYTAALWLAIEPLLALGVPVLAAAGNYSTTRRFYPAAFAEAPTPADQAPVVSVGALNPNGSRALFSDGGGWVRAWASGAAVVSAFPDVDGSRGPEIRLPASPGDRAALDPDDFSEPGGCGMAIWSGTSFSAPLLAAQLARRLLGGAAADGGLRLDVAGQDAAVTRARQALDQLGWPG